MAFHLPRGDSRREIRKKVLSIYFSMRAHTNTQGSRADDGAASVALAGRPSVFL
jgi:hypothetical protein